MISVVVSGTVGRDPETRQVGERDVCSFSVASDGYAKGAKVTTWVRVSVWGKRAGVAQRFLQKGMKVVARGALVVSEREGKTYLDLDAEDFEFSGGERRGQARQEDDSDVPF